MKKRLLKQTILNEMSRLGSIDLVAHLYLADKDMKFEISKPMIYEDGKVVRMINNEQFELEEVGSFLESIIDNLTNIRIQFNGQDSKLTQLV